MRLVKTLSDDMPVTVAEAKAALRIVGTDEDRFIRSLILAATRAVEAHLGYTFLDATVRDLDAPEDGEQIITGRFDDISAVPSDVVEAIRQLVVHLYEHRGVADAPGVPLIVEQLLLPHRSFA